MQYLLITAFSFLLITQTDIVPKRVTLTVVDNITFEPVTGAYVKTMGSEEIYQTNEHGQVTFFVIEKQTKYKVFINQVDYYRTKVPIGLLLENEKNKQQNIIYLVKKPVFDKNILTKMREGTHSYQDLQAFLMQSANNLFKLAPRNPHQYKGLVRKIGVFGERYSYLQEALITIQDDSYLSAEYPHYLSPPFKIKVDAIRQTQETAQIDSAYIKKVLGLVPRGGVDKPLNYLYKCYRSNYYRLIFDPFTVFASGESLLDGCDFQLIDVFDKEEDTFYKIAYEGEPMLKNSYFTINQSDQAIVEFSRNQYNQGQLLNEVKVKLQKSMDGKYYPYFIELVEPRVISPLEIPQYNIVQMFLYDLGFDLKELEKSEILLATDEINETMFPLSSETWQSFFAQHPELALPKEIYQQLSEQIPLEEQFR